MTPRRVSSRASRRAAAHAAAVALVLAGACTPGRDVASLGAPPPLRVVKPVQPRRVALPNGLVVFLQEDHELPLVSGAAYVRGGSHDEPAEKAGLVSIYGQVWRTGGTEQRTGDALDDELESRAAKVESGGDGDSTSLSFSCLKGDFEAVFSTFVELLRTPAFREDKLPLATAQLAAGIARRNDSAGEIASREAEKLAYGPRSAVARVPEYATVGAITRDDLVAWHKRHVHPNRILLGLSGDFDATALEARLRQAFGDWPRGPDYQKPDLGIAEPAPGVYFVPKNDVNQSVVRMVHLGLTKRHPDFHAVTVLNEVLGGGFASRLFSTLRTKKGLAYGVGGGVGTGYDIPGVARLAIGTKSGTTAAAIEGLFGELERLKKEPPTQAEIDRAKAAILNSFVFRYDSRAKVLNARLLYEFHGYPADFLEQYRAGIEKVTPADVARAANAHLHRDKLRVLVVGKAAAFDKPLSTFGPVTTVDITIPPPPGR